LPTVFVEAIQLDINDINKADVRFGVG